jgi:transcription antitermination factor NusG
MSEHEEAQMRDEVPDAGASVSHAQWYVACTMPRHEKKVAEQLGGKSVEYFLPLYRSVHRWKDRRTEVELPLFPGYVFVRIPVEERLRVLSVPSVNRFVSFQGPPVAMPEEEMERLRRGLDHVKAQPHPFLRAGQAVRIKHGPLSGAEGLLVRSKDNCRVIISIELLMQSVSVEVDFCDLEIN